MKKHLLIFYLCITTLSLASTALAQTTSGFADIDTYHKGNLNGQDGWSREWNSLLVQDDVTFDGLFAIKNQQNAEASGYKDLSEEFFDLGVVTAWIRIDNNSISDNQGVLGIFKGISEESVAIFRFANNFDGRDNTMLISVAGSTDTKNVGQITQGEWHKISLGWRKGDFNIRVKIDGNEWSEWFSSQTSWKEGEPLGIRITLPNAHDYGDFYIDGLETYAGVEDVPSIVEIVEEETVPEVQSITSPVDTTSTSTVTTNIDGDLPETALSTEESVKEESITTPLDEGGTPTTTTTEF